MAKKTFNHRTQSIETWLQNHFELDPHESYTHWVEKVLHHIKATKFSTIILHGGHKIMGEDKLGAQVVREIEFLKTKTELSEQCIKSGFSYLKHELVKDVPNSSIFKFPENWSTDLVYKYQYKDGNIFSLSPLHKGSESDNTLKEFNEEVPMLGSSSCCDGIGTSCPSPGKCTSCTYCCTSGKTCGISFKCCPNEGDICVGDKCCSSGKSCGGVHCCPHKGDTCVGDECCSSGKSCGGVHCCPNKGDICVGDKCCSSGIHCSGKCCKTGESCIDGGGILEPILSCGTIKPIPTPAPGPMPKTVKYICDNNNSVNCTDYCASGRGGEGEGGTRNATCVPNKYNDAPLAPPDCNKLYGDESPPLSCCICIPAPPMPESSKLICNNNGTVTCNEFCSKGLGGVPKILNA